MIESAPKKRGCLLYGYVTAIILLVVTCVMLFIGYRLLKAKVDQGIAVYTDSVPVSVEREEVSPDRLKELQQRVANFQAALDQQDVRQELVLSASDLNALLAGDASFKEFRDKLHVFIDGDRIKGKVSMPLKDIGPLKLNGRFLNGLASFKVSLEKGRLDVRLDEVEVKGRPLPAVVMNELKKQNLAQEAGRDPQTATRIEQFESIQIQDGKVILRNRVKQ